MKINLKKLIFIALLSNTYQGQSYYHDHYWWNYNHPYWYNPYLREDIIINRDYEHRDRLIRSEELRNEIIELKELRDAKPWRAAELTPKIKERERRLRDLEGY